MGRTVHPSTHPAVLYVINKFQDHLSLATLPKPRIAFRPRLGPAKQSP